MGPFSYFLGGQAFPKIKVLWWTAREHVIRNIFQSSEGQTVGETFRLVIEDKAALLKFLDGLPQNVMVIQGKMIYPPLSPHSGQGHFLVEGCGGVCCEASHSNNFVLPPFVHTPPLERHFRSEGWGCIKFGPVCKPPDGLY